MRVINSLRLYCDLSFFRTFYMYLEIRFRKIYQLHIKSCKKEHYWKENFYCARCNLAYRDFRTKEVLK